jgi:hypothetical protein
MRMHGDEDVLTYRQVWADLRNLAVYERAARSPLTRQSILCPLCKMGVETWHRLSDLGRWYRLQDGLRELLAEKVSKEPCPWRAATYGFLWIRFYFRMSRDEAQEVLSRTDSIKAALEGLLRGKKPGRTWCGMCTGCFRTWRRVSTANGSGGR